MDKLWAVIQREFLERVRTKWFVISTLLGPVLFAAMLFLPAWLALRNSASRDTADIVILDATGAGLGERVRAALHAPGATAREPALTGNTEVRVVAPGELAAAERAASQAVMRKATQGYLVLDARALGGDSAFYAGGNADRPVATRAASRCGAARPCSRSPRARGLDPARIDSSPAAPPPRHERLSSAGRGGSGQANVIFAVGVSFLLYTAIILYGQNVPRSVIEEKQTRVARS
jgi:ABC-2 type transport system permease protein